MIDKKKYITQLELSKRLNIAPPDVTRYLKKGIIEKHENGLIDYKKAKKIIESNREIYSPNTKSKIETKSQKKTTPRKKDKKTKTYAEARTEHETYKAKMAKLDYLKKRGDLVDKKTRISICQNIIVIAKTKLLSLSTKTAPQLVGVKSIKKIKNIIDREIYQALDELSKLDKIE